MTASGVIFAHELGHPALVDRRRVLFHAGRNLFAGLVKAARAVGAFVVLVQRSCRGSHRRTRADDDARGDHRTIRRAAPMGASAGVDADRVGGVVRASLSPRRAALAGLDCLRPADAGLGPQFPFYPEHQLPGNHQSATPLVVGRRDGLGAGRRNEPLDLDRPTKCVASAHLFRGCHDQCLAAW